MNTVSQREFKAAATAQAEASRTAASTSRARLYHFFELALAHPGEDGIDYFGKETTEQEFLDLHRAFPGEDGEPDTEGTAAARAFFTALRELSYEDVEAAHIAMFSANFPHLPCPPYGSLYTAREADKRLEEMAAIKNFYQRNGVDISDSFTDLPDHVCVELEFAQLLAFREAEAATVGDGQVLANVRTAQAEFLDRYLLPLAQSLAELSAASMPDNPYTSLLKVMRRFLLQHRRELGETPLSQTRNQEVLP